MLQYYFGLLRDGIVRFITEYASKFYTAFKYMQILYWGCDTKTQRCTKNRFSAEENYKMEQRRI